MDERNQDCSGPGAGPLRGEQQHFGNGATQSVPKTSGPGFDSLPAAQKALQAESRDGPYTRESLLALSACGAAAAPTLPEQSTTVHSKTPSASVWENIPQELRMQPQWCVAGLNKRPLNIALIPASVTDPRTWAPFENVAAVANANGLGIGYVLTQQGGLTCIDLDPVNEITQRLKGQPIDPSKWTTPEQLNRFKKIIETFDSYTERSRSGEGWHIWVRGSIGAGCRLDGVEAYSQERFIICTGDVVLDRPMAERQGWLDVLVAEIRRGQVGVTGHSASLPLVEVPPNKADDEVWKALCRHQKWPKIAALCRGEWQALGFPSASEGDLSLIEYIANSTPSNEQVRRLFRQTVLAQHQRKGDKHLKSNYHIDSALAVVRTDQQALLQKLQSSPFGIAMERKAAEYAAEREAAEARKRAEAEAIARFSSNLRLN